MRSSKRGRKRKSQQQQRARRGERNPSISNQRPSRLTHTRHRTRMSPVRRTTNEGPTAKSPRQRQQGRGAKERGGEKERERTPSLTALSVRVATTAFPGSTLIPKRPRSEARNRPRRGRVREFALRQKPTLNRAWPRERPRAAMCVRNVDDQGVLQFTLIHAVGCVLHRRGSRAIHRLQLFFSLSNRARVRGGRAAGTRPSLG